MDDFSRNLDQTGQHYMIDKKLVRFIVDSADLKDSDVVLEIGYGKGALTKELVKRCKVVAIDIEKNDLDSIDHQLTIIHGNILEKFEELYRKHKFNKIVSNIPYNISEPLSKILFHHQDIELIVITVGKNFADIITAQDNRIGIIANELYHIEKLKHVGAKAFSPPPRVDSTVLRFERKEAKTLYHGLVMYDDLKLKNALSRLDTGKTKKQIRELASGPLFSKRLYELSNEEFLLFDERIKTLNLK